MAEEDLKKAILERVKKEKENILHRANREKEELIKQAETEASSFREGYLLEIKKRCSLKKAVILNQINLETEKRLLEAKERKISEVLSFVKENLRAIHQDGKRYKSIFGYLLQESLMILRKDKDTTLKLKVHPSDQKLATEMLGDFKVDAQIQTQESIDAGVIISDVAENMSIVNTFEYRLKKIIPEVRQEIGSILFEGL